MELGIWIRLALLPVLMFVAFFAIQYLGAPFWTLSATAPLWCALLLLDKLIVQYRKKQKDQETE